MVCYPQFEALCLRGLQWSLPTRALCPPPSLVVLPLSPLGGVYRPQVEARNALRTAELLSHRPNLRVPQVTPRHAPQVTSRHVPQDVPAASARHGSGVTGSPRQGTSLRSHRRAFVLRSYSDYAD